MKIARGIASLLVGALSFGTRPARSCSFEPVAHLLESLGQAETIALVRVDAFEGRDSTSETDAGEADRTMLVTVVEAWKGAASGQIRIGEAFEVSAGGHRVVPGDQVLVLLESGETQVREMRETLGSDVPDDETSRWEQSRLGRWFSVGAVFLVADEDVSGLRDLVRDGLALQAAGPVPERARRAWLVEATALGPSRLAALSDLQILARKARPRGPDSEAETGNETALSEEELSAIGDAYVRDPRADESVPLLMELLAGHADDRLDAAWLAAIEAGIAAPKIPLWIPEAIRWLIVRSGHTDWGAEMWERDRAADTLRARWPAVRSDLNLPAPSSALPPVSE